MLTPRQKPKLNTPRVIELLEMLLVELRPSQEISKLTFSEAADLFLKKKRPLVKESTYCVYLSACDALKHSFGDYLCEKIDGAFIRQYIADHAGKYARSVLKNTIVIIRMILKSASEEGLIRDVILPSEKLPEKRKKARQTLTDPEYGKLKDYCLNHIISRGALGTLTAMMTGLRIGEICALRWADIHLHERLIHVRSTRQRVYDITTRSTRLIDGTPKSLSSQRDVPIPDELFETLSKIPCQTGFVAHPYPNGTEVRTLRTAFDNLCAKAGIERIHFHALLHTFISRAIASGGSVKAVSEIVGHADTSITMNIYTHIGMTDKRNAMKGA